MATPNSTKKYWDHVHRRCLWVDSRFNHANNCAWCGKEIDVEDIPATATCPYCGYDTLLDEDHEEHVSYAIRLISKADLAYLDWLSAKYGRDMDYVDYYKMTSTLQVVRLLDSYDTSSLI